MDINLTLFGQFITFGILVWFTMKYVWPPVIKAMHDREKKIAAGLEAAELGKRELVLAKEKALSIIRDAKVEASQLIEQANVHSVKIIEQAKREAKLEGKRLIDMAQSEIVREIAQVKESLRSQVATLAVAGAEKIIQRNIDISMQHDLLNNLVAEI
jgi:F-type H+-transporting ATPase subunit b